MLCIYMLLTSDHDFLLSLATTAPIRFTRKLKCVTSVSNLQMHRKAVSDSSPLAYIHFSQTNTDEANAYFAHLSAPFRGSVDTTGIH